MTGYIDPTKQTFAAFRANDRPGAIHMLNLVRLRARAAYSDGRGDRSGPTRLMAAKAVRCSRGSAARSSGAAHSS